MSVDKLQRLFIALELPATVRATLSALAEPMRGVTWVPEQNLHLTLRFIGEGDSGTADRLAARLREVRVAPFPLPIAGVGRFPPRGPARIMWVGVGTGHPHLFQLRQLIDDLLLSEGFGREIRDFLPHVTLARCGPDTRPGAVDAWLRRRRETDAGDVRVTSFTLFQSDLRPDGAVYQVVERYDVDK